MEQNRIPRNTPIQLQPSDIFAKRPKIYSGEKIASSTNGTQKTAYLLAED
jgi:hypothetical protein